MTRYSILGRDLEFEGPEILAFSDSEASAGRDTPVFVSSKEGDSRTGSKRLVRIYPEGSRSRGKFSWKPVVWKEGYSTEEQETERQLRDLNAIYESSL